MGRKVIRWLPKHTTVHKGGSDPQPPRQDRIIIPFHAASLSQRFSILSLANIQIDTRTELAFNVLEFPGGGVEKGLGILQKKKKTGPLKCSCPAETKFLSP